MKKFSLIAGLLMVLALLLPLGYARSMQENKKINAQQEKYQKSAVGIRDNPISVLNVQSEITTSKIDPINTSVTDAPYIDRLEDLRNANAASNGNSNSYIGYVNPVLPQTSFYIYPDITTETNQSRSNGGSRMETALQVNKDWETEETGQADGVPENNTDQYTMIEPVKPGDNDKQKDGDKSDNGDKREEKDNPGNSDKQKDKDKDRDKSENGERQKDKDNPGSSDKQKDKDKDRDNSDNADRQKDRDNPGSSDKQKDKDKDRNNSDNGDRQKDKENRGSSDRQKGKN